MRIREYDSWRSQAQSQVLDVSRLVDENALAWAVLCRRNRHGNSIMKAGVRRQKRNTRPSEASNAGHLARRQSGRDPPMQETCFRRCLLNTSGAVAAGAVLGSPRAEKEHRGKHRKMRVLSLLDKNVLTVFKV
jgi:hypothetical protein